MVTLEGIWITSWTLATLSITIFTGLVVKRMIDQARDKKFAARRHRLEGLLFASMADPDILRNTNLSRQDRLTLGRVMYELADDIRGDGFRLLIALLDELHVDQAFLDALSDKNPANRLAAVFGLSLFDNDAAFDGLWSAMKDPLDDIRLAAARATVLSKRQFSVPDFVETLGIGTEMQTRELRIIVEELAKRDPDGVIKALKDNDNRDRRLFLLYGLGRSGAFHIAPALMHYANDSDIEIRAQAIRSLATLNHPDAKATIMAALEDPSWVVRAQAAQAVADIGLPAAIARLESMLDDDEWWVRYRAAEALWNISDLGQARLRLHQTDSPRLGRIIDLVISEAEWRAA